jgi:hemerythrin-like domain-containing protein
VSGIDLTTMLAIHHGLRRDLRRFAAAATATPAGDTRAWSALLNRWDLFEAVLEDHHHNEDRVVWPLLRERAAAAGDAEALRVLAEAEAEHDGIDAVLRPARGALAVRRDATGAVERARRVLERHLDHEEAEALPLLGTYVGAAEWGEVQARLRTGPPARLLLSLPAWLLDELPAELAHPLVAGAGWHLRLIARLGAPRLRRLDRRAFRHVPQSAPSRIPVAGSRVAP